MLAFVTNIQTSFADVVKGNFIFLIFSLCWAMELILLPMVLWVLPAGWLLQHIGYKKTVLSALAVGFIGVTITLFRVLGSFAIYLTELYFGLLDVCVKCTH